MVTFQSDRTSQNVWSKRTWESSPEEIERRVDASGRVVRSVNETKSMAEVAARDQAVDALAKILNIGKQQARDYAKDMTVQEIERDITKRRRSLSR